MAAHIPFINGETDCELVKAFYSDTKILRLSLEKATKLGPKLPKSAGVWIDAGVDGLHRPLSQPHDDDWKTHISQFPEYAAIGDPAFQAKPDPKKVADFVNAVLDACFAQDPAGITVPQLPIVNGTSRNKINKLMADAAGDWSLKKKYDGKMVLPAIFTDQKQLNLKTERNKKREVILACFQRSRSNVVWAVDSTLGDQLGSPTFQSARFPGVIAFHSEMLKELPDKTSVIAGPYWGLNLVLWVKQLCRAPAIGVGSAYQYHLSGGPKRTPVVRLAVPPLKRWVRITGLRDWLTKAMDCVNAGDPAYTDLSYLKTNLTALSTKEASRRQIAQFYKQWLGEIEAVPAPGRALALYQMLSSAYVLGKTLPSFPDTEKTAMRPERVAEYLMLSCL